MSETLPARIREPSLGRCILLLATLGASAGYALPKPMCI